MKKSKSYLIFVGVLISAMMVITACGGAAPAVEEEAAEDAAPAEEEAAEEAAPAEETKDYVFCQLNTNLAEPWMVQMDEDIKLAAAEYPNEDYPVNITIQYKDAQGDALRHRAQVEECVVAGVDAILISPVEADPLTEPLAEAYDAGIPIFLVARGVNGEKYTQYIGSDEWALGYAAGQWIVDNYAGTAAKVVELQGQMTSTPAQERHEGFMKALEGSDVEVIFSADVEWSEPNARSEMESALAVYDDIDVVFGANDPAAHGAYVAAKAVGREGEMAFIGIDGLPYEGQVYVNDGVFAMTIIDITGGDIALHNAVKYLSGEDIGEKVYYKDAVMYTPNGKEVVTIPEGVR